LRLPETDVRSLLWTAEPSAQSRLSDNATVRVNAIETDRYGRTVAEIFLGESFINAEMVREGYAWHYERYSGNCPNRGAIVQAAQQTELTGTPPWEFRRQN
jgi:endonuclease YncB( thermonuclease family)